MLDDAVAQGANGIVITWRIFGSNGVVDWSRAPVTEQYTRAAPPDWNKGWGVKTLFKFDPEYWKLGIHRPSIRNKHLESGFADSVRWLNGSGRPMPDYFRFHGWRSIRRSIGYDWAQMNHYAVKSVESYALRKFRGNVNNKTDKYNADYWALQDRNEVPDTRILRHAPRRAEIMAELLRDPVLARLHEEALAKAEARLAGFRETEAYRALRDSLVAAGQVPIANVEAKPPKLRDPTRIAELMIRVSGERAEGRPAPEAPAPLDPYPPVVSLSEGVDTEWIRNQEIELPADPGVFSETALAAVRAGKFDRRHARNIAATLGDAVRLLDVGGGVGLVAMKALRANPRLVVMLQDDRPGLADAAKLVHRRNRMGDSSRLRVVGGPLRLGADGPDEARGLAACLNDFRPDTLRLSRPTRSAPPRWPPCRWTRCAAWSSRWTGKRMPRRSAPITPPRWRSSALPKAPRPRTAGRWCLCAGPPSSLNRPGPDPRPVSLAGYSDELIDLVLYRATLGLRDDGQCAAGLDPAIPAGFGQGGRLLPGTDDGRPAPLGAQGA